MKKIIHPMYILVGAAFYFAINGKEAFDILPKHFELIGFSVREIGFIMSFTGFGGMIILPFLVFVVDSFRKKTILTIALLLNILVPLLYFVPMQPPSLYAIPRMLQGMLISVVFIGFTATQSLIIPDHRRSRGFALFGIMGQLGILSSIVIGEAVYEHWSFLAFYLFTALIFASSCILFLQFPEERYNSSNKKAKFSDLLEVLKHRQVYPIVFWIFIFGYTFGTMITFIPKMVLSTGLTYIRPFYIAFPISVIATRLTVSHFFDRLPKSVVLIAPLSLLPLSLYFVSMMSSNVQLMIAGALYGFCHAILFPVLLAFLMDYAPAHVHGRMSLLYQLFTSLGIFVASNIGGLIAEKSIEATFMVTALFAASGLPLLIIVLVKTGIVKKMRNG